MANQRWKIDRERRDKEALLFAESYPNKIVRRIVVIDNETTLKRYFKKAKQIELHPANSTMKPIILKDREVEIRGVMVGLLRVY